jgi:single stranded DNA-binding protein
VDQEEQDTGSGLPPSLPAIKEQIMAFARVEQRNAHLAGPVKLDFVNGRDGKVAKAMVTAISNTRRGSGEAREEESTSILWTLWGKQAENAAEYLGKGSHVNIVGRLRNNNYQDAEGKDVYGLAFICEEIDYLDSKAESEARRARQGEGVAPATEARRPAAMTGKANGRTRPPGKAGRAAQADASDIPF